MYSAVLLLLGVLAIILPTPTNTMGKDKGKDKGRDKCSNGKSTSPKGRDKCSNVTTTIIPTGLISSSRVSGTTSTTRQTATTRVSSNHVSTRPTMSQLKHMYVTTTPNRNGLMATISSNQPISNILAFKNNINNNNITNIGAIGGGVAGCLLLVILGLIVGVIVYKKRKSISKQSKQNIMEQNPHYATIDDFVPDQNGYSDLNGDLSTKGTELVKYDEVDIDQTLNVMNYDHTRVDNACMTRRLDDNYNHITIDNSSINHVETNAESTPAYFVLEKKQTDDYNTSTAVTADMVSKKDNANLQSSPDYFILKTDDAKSDITKCNYDEIDVKSTKYEYNHIGIDIYSTYSRPDASYHHVQTEPLSDDTYHHISNVSDVNNSSSMPNCNYHHINVTPLFNDNYNHSGIPAASDVSTSISDDTYHHINTPPESDMCTTKSEDTYHHITTSDEADVSIAPVLDTTYHHISDTPLSSDNYQHMNMPRTSDIHTTMLDDTYHHISDALSQTINTNI